MIYSKPIRSRTQDLRHSRQSYYQKLSSITTLQRYVNIINFSTEVTNYAIVLSENPKISLS